MCKKYITSCISPSVAISHSNSKAKLYEIIHCYLHKKQKMLALKMATMFRQKVIKIKNLRSMQSVTQ